MYISFTIKNASWVLDALTLLKYFLLIGSKKILINIYFYYHILTLFSIKNYN